MDGMYVRLHEKDRYIYLKILSQLRRECFEETHD